MDLSVYDYAAGPKAHKRAYVLSESHYVYTRQFRLGEYIRLWHPGHCNWTSVRRDQSENVPATKRRQGPFCSAPSRNPLQKPSPKTRSTLSFAESHRMYGTLFVIHKSRDGFDAVSWQPKLHSIPSLWKYNLQYNSRAAPGRCSVRMTEALACLSNSMKPEGFSYTKIEDAHRHVLLRPVGNSKQIANPHVWNFPCECAHWANVSLRQRRRWHQSG